jgi:hypothetical protein
MSSVDSPSDRRTARGGCWLFRGQLGSEGDAIHQWRSKRKGEIGFAIGSSIIAHTFRPDLSNGLMSLNDGMPVAFIKVNDTRMMYDQDQSAGTLCPVRI